MSRPAIFLTLNEARLVALQIRKSETVDREYWPWVIEELCRRLEGNSEKRLFPIQSQKGARPHPLQIPWSIAELAYSVYVGLYGPCQTLERLAERGGFGPGEMDAFLPDWRERCDEMIKLRATLKATLEELQQRGNSCTI